VNEAPFSWNSHYTLRGWPCQLTIRADDYESLSGFVTEAITQLEKAGAVPAEMIWAAKPKAPAQVHPIANPPPPTYAQPPLSKENVPFVTARRPVGRPKKVSDTYIESGVEKCGHITTDHAVCAAEGYWEDKDDQFRPGKTWRAWRCPQYFIHQDYVDKHPELAEKPF